MVRIADLVEGTLIEPSFDDKKEKILDNRPLIYCDEGPNEPDACGFWEWTERKNEFGKWRTQATYLQYPSPIEIIVFDNYISHCLQNKQSVKFSINSAFFIEMCYNKCKKIIKSNKKACT